jgi:Family of unknown function (DUF6111)
MLRLVIENILLFLAPTLIYVAYILLRRQLDDGDSSNQTDSTQPNAASGFGSVMNDAPFIWLALTGAALVFAVLALFGSVSTSNPNATYEPAVYKDGKIVPGRIK